MSDATAPIVTQSPTYKAALARGFFHALATVCGAIMTGLAGTNWAAADGQTKFLIIVGIVASVTSTGAAFMDKTMARLGEGKAAIASGTTPPFPPATPSPSKSPIVP